MKSRCNFFAVVMITIAVLSMSACQIIEEILLGSVSITISDIPFAYNNQLAEVRVYGATGDNPLATAPRVQINGGVITVTMLEAETQNPFMGSGTRVSFEIFNAQGSVERERKKRNISVFRGVNQISFLSFLDPVYVEITGIPVIHQNHHHSRYAEVRLFDEDNVPPLHFITNHSRMPIDGAAIRINVLPYILNRTLELGSNARVSFKMFDVPTGGNYRLSGTTELRPVNERINEVPWSSAITPSDKPISLVINEIPPSVDRHWINNATGESGTTTVYLTNSALSAVVLLFEEGSFYVESENISNQPPPIAISSFFRTNVNYVAPDLLGNIPSTRDVPYDLDDVFAKTFWKDANGLSLVQYFYVRGSYEVFLMILSSHDVHPYEIVTILEFPGLTSPEDFTFGENTLSFLEFRCIFKYIRGGLTGDNNNITGGRSDLARAFSGDFGRQFREGVIRARQARALQ